MKNEKSTVRGVKILRPSLGLSMICCILDRRSTPSIVESISLRRMTMISHLKEQVELITVLSEKNKNQRNQGLQTKPSVNQ